MTNDERLTTGWKATIVLTMVLSVLALGTQALGGRTDTRPSDQQQRIRDLEVKLQELQATGGGTRPKDRSYGE